MEYGTKRLAPPGRIRRQFDWPEVGNWVAVTDADDETDRELAGQLGE